jgi:hypothetical protein
MPALTVRNAEIRTASVEVKTLAMSGKQVTLAVFRQLREQPLIAEDGRLNGQPWGVINYHPDKCADALPHLHVVWQSGSDLFRASELVDAQFDPYFDAAAGSDYLESQVRYTLACGVGRLPGSRDEQIRKEVNGLTVRIKVSDAVIAALSVHELLEGYRGDLAGRGDELVWTYESRVDGGGGRVERPLRQVVAKLEAQLDERINKLNGTALQAATQRLVDEVAVECERRVRHRAARKALADLPQLFIAV